MGQDFRFTIGAWVYITQDGPTAVPLRVVARYTEECIGGRQLAYGLRMWRGGYTPLQDGSSMPICSRVAEFEVEEAPPPAPPIFGK